jgi:hypothetical protein
MALAQYTNMHQGVTITRHLGAPKKATLKAWYQACCKVIKELPKLSDAPVPLNGNPAPIPRSEDFWYLFTEPEVSIQWIKFTLMNGLDEKAHLVIDRSKPSIG